MDAFDRLVEKHFPKENPLKMLMEMVEKELSSFVPKSPLREVEEQKSATRTYTIHEIPLIPISELGWANNEGGEEGDTQRSVLESWLKGIEGTGFQDKLNNVIIRMKTGFGDIPKGGDTKEYIQEVMSYLVFLKTLTMAITNFNASAAGFNFEAFLSALMGGEQIPASGADTIADIFAPIDGEVIPISLKLYSEKGLEVGGSYFDLSNDLISPNEQWAAWASKPEYAGGAIRYIACTKDFEEVVKGDPLSRKGNINFYQFDISRNNLFDIFSVVGKDANRTIASEASFVKRLADWDKGGMRGEIPFVGLRDEEGNVSQLPAKSEKGDPNELADTFENYLRSVSEPMWIEIGIAPAQAEVFVKTVR